MLKMFTTATSVALVQQLMFFGNPILFVSCGMLMRPKQLSMAVQALGLNLECVRWPARSASRILFSSFLSATLLNGRHQ